MKKILLVEDDQDIVEALKKVLPYDVTAVSDGTSCLQALVHHFDVILLDILLPDMSGITLCKAIRRTCATPLIFLTCLNNEEDIIAGLQAGGDDYITKPFRLGELKARIHSLLRRSVSTDMIETGDLHIDIAHYELYKSGKKLECTPLIFALIVKLARSRTVLTRDYLLTWLQEETGHYVEDNTLSVHMKRVRDLLGDYHGTPYVATVRGIGYRWNI